MAERPDSELPESRREYVPPPLRPPAPESEASRRRSERERQGGERFTGPEQLVFAPLVMACWLSAAFALRLWDSPLTGREFMVLLLAGVLPWLAVETYGSRCPPWPGPRWWTQRKQASVAKQPSRPVRALNRFFEWWFLPGRPGLLVAAVGVFLVLTSLSTISSDRRLFDDLNDRGIETSARVADLDFAPRAGRVATDVRFIVNGQERTEELSLNDGEALSVPEGALVRVVYDPLDPSRVVLTSQLDEHHIKDSKIMAWFGVVLVPPGLIWWFVNIPRRSALGRGLDPDAPPAG